MANLPGPASVLRLLLVPMLLALLGCVGSGGGGMLYVFDATSRTVLAWKDLSEVYQAAKDGQDIPKADHKIESKQFSSLNLALGGLVVDRATDQLFLVGENGIVYRVPRASTQNGELANKSDITSFNLGSSTKDPLPSGSVFGPAAIDPNRNVLYVMENSKDGQAARLWHVAKANDVGHQATLAANEHDFAVEGDCQGAAVTAGSDGKVYALFGSGKNIEDVSGNPIRGPRLRQGQSKDKKGAFPTNAHKQGINLIIGDGTRIKGPIRTGTLAYDVQHQELYVYAPPRDHAGKGNILVFNSSQFNGGVLDPAPTRVLEGAPRGLRILAHARTLDWMVGAGRPDTDPGNPDSAGKKDRAPAPEPGKKPGPGQVPAPGKEPGPGQVPDKNPVPEPDHPESLFIAKLTALLPKVEQALDRILAHGPAHGQDSDRGGKTDQVERPERSGATGITIWKSPSGGEPPVQVPRLPGVGEIRGLAITGK